MTQHTLSLGPLSLLATQTGPLLTIAIHAPSDTAPVGRMTLTVAEWTSLVALVDCMGAAEREMARLREERDGWKACAARTGTERRSDEMRAIHDADSLRQQVRELTEERDWLRARDENNGCAHLPWCDDMGMDNHDPSCPANAVTLQCEASQLRSDLAAALVSVDAMAERIEQMRPVYERAVVLSELRAKQRSLDDMNYDQMDGQIVDAMDAIDTALAHTAREQAKENP